MSIFRSTFTQEIKDQIGIRQDAIFNRTPQSLQYLNSRNSWIRMTSAVDVNDDKAALAKQYILQGGTLSDNGRLKSGLGDFNNAYSNKAADSTPYRLGIRPMPGITSIEIKSKSAYGSLREVVVNFQCWDIKQLEDLELLYMRPGYTALIEWGWTPYLQNPTKPGGAPIYKSTFDDYYDIINKPPTDRTKLFADLFKKSKDHSGNYDAMYGYIKNYSWSARMDGGYDCQTTIISTGEIIESLKVNYIPKDINNTLNSALLANEVQNPSSLSFSSYYAKNILAGLWYELYTYITDTTTKFYTKNSLITLEKTLKLKNAPLGIDNSKEGFTNTNNQAYITLDLMCDIINKYVIPKDDKDNNLIDLSLNTSIITDSGSALLCISHPLQISVDPTVCLIKNDRWAGKDAISTVNKEAIKDNITSIKYNAQQAYNFIINENYKDGFNLITNSDVYNELNKIFSTSNKSKTLQDFLNTNLPPEKTTENQIITLQQIFQNQTNLSFTYKPKPATINVPIPTYESNSITLSPPQPSSISATLDIANNSQKALANIEMLNNIPLPYFIDENEELGTIKNIYVNLHYLYKLALNQNLELQDKKEKNEINLYSYLKNIIRGIQSAIGSVSNFEIHVDPIDNKTARIIDINYTGEKDKNTYNNLFELQIHNLKSTVRSYSMQSQMFPEQGALIAIGSQAKGGQMGMQNNTMIDFNKSLTDRIINKKLTSSDKDLEKEEEAKKQNTSKVSFTLNNNLNSIVKALNAFNTTPVANTQQGDAQQLYDDAKNALRDTIVYFQSITTSTSKNRNLIPIKFSFEMDGIGGLVIGHMFKLPSSVIPRGYRGENGVGSQLGQAITSISHTLSNNDWVTKIDALNIVLNDNTGSFNFKDLDLTKIFTGTPSVNYVYNSNIPAPVVLTAGVYFSSLVTYYVGVPLVEGQVNDGIKITKQDVSIEGGGIDRHGYKINTIEDYLEGKAPYVTIAMDTLYDGYYFTNDSYTKPDGTLILFKCMDTGGAFKGKESSKIDIATRSLAIARGSKILNIGNKKLPSEISSVWKLDPRPRNTLNR